MCHEDFTSMTRSASQRYKKYGTYFGALSSSFRIPA